MRILACPADKYGCAWYRIFVPYSHLGTAHEVFFSDAIHEKLFKSSDVLVTQRISTPHMLEVARLYKKEGRPFIMDIDDNIHSLHSDNTANSMYGAGKQATKIFEEAMGLATVMCISTPKLAREYARFANDIMVCPLFLPNEIFTGLAPDPSYIWGVPRVPGEFRIGYVGSSSHRFDLALLTKALTKICERFPQVKLVFFGMPPEELWHLRERIYYQGFVDPGERELPGEFLRRYYSLLRAQQLDIALAPLAPTLFNACKSNLKCLEYGACGYPILASSFLPYREYVEAHPGAIHLVDNDWKSWFTALVRFIEDDAARAILAHINHTAVKVHHTTTQGIRPWHTMLNRFAAGAAIGNGPFRAHTV